MQLNRSLRAGAALAALGLALTACGGDDDASGEGEALRVCSDIPFEPFEFEDGEGGFTGFDIDLIEAVGDEIGRDVEVIVTGFDGIQSGTALGADQCDIAVSAMTITEEREENLDFTDPYFDADQSLLVAADSGITDLDGMAGLVIGVQSETTGADYAAENAPSDAEIIDFPSGAEAISALQAGQVDGVIQDFPVNVEAANNDDNLTIAAEFPTGEQYGFAVAEEGSEDLLDSVNTALQTLRDNGTYDDIFDKYFAVSDS